ncbi:MAG: ATP synthase subunit I [bacterium]|nr:ATP synthase subunit I [bacterium]
MQEFFLARKKIIRGAIDLMIICSMVSIVLKRWDFAFGFLLGTMLSIFNFKILASDILKICTLQVKKEKIKGYIFVRYGVRYLLTFLILFISLKNQNINIYTCLAGLFFIKFSALWNYSLKYFLGGRVWVSL